MPYELTWDEPWGVVATYHGRISAQDIARICREVTEDDRWDALRYVLVDALDIDGVDVDTSSAASLAEPNILLIGAARAHGPLHFGIATRNVELLHMLARQGELGAFPCETAVFDTPAAAREWIRGVTG